MMTRKKAAVLVTTLGLMALSVQAQTMDHSNHGTQAGHDMSSPSTQAFMDANMKMHADMAIPFTGDADIDFIRGMIPHHEGAVDMARIVLEHGKDAEVSKLAESIIAAQESEIAWMKAWLEENAK